jgi:hypothetical protein
MTFSAPRRRDGILNTAFKADFKEESTLLCDLFFGSIGYRQYFPRLPMDKGLICTFLFLWQDKASMNELQYSGRGFRASDF